MADVSFQIFSLIKDHMININFLYEVGQIFIFCHVTYNIGGKFEEKNCWVRIIFQEYLLYFVLGNCYIVYGLFQFIFFIL